MLKSLWKSSIIALIMLCIVSAHPNLLALAAQAPYQWTDMERIPDFDQSTRTPYLVADKNRTIHVFASDLLDDEDPPRAVVYRQWTVEKGWTKPIDILLPPIKREARIRGALLDEKGLMHVIFYAGDENGANIYYAQAPATMAGHASAWTSPQIVGPFANINDDAVITSDRLGNLHIIFSGTSDGNGLYVVHSSDAGRSWSEPMSIFLTYDQDLTPYDLNAYTDAQDNLHLVWAINNEFGRTDSIYYAKLQAYQETWSTPTEIDHVGDIPAGLPAIIEYDDDLFLIYHAYDNKNPVGVTRHMRRSSDGGKTWSEKVRLFPHVGSNGPPSLVIDSNNVLHMFFGGRITQNNQIVGGMYHSIWQDEQWTAPEPLAVDPQSSRRDRGSSYPRAIVSQGKVILVTSMADPALIEQGTGGTWFSYVVLDAPELPVVALPPLVESVDVTPTPTDVLPTGAVTNAASAVGPTPVSGLSTPKPLSAPSGSRNSPATLLVLGLGPTFLLIMAMVAAKYSANRGHH